MADIDLTPTEEMAANAKRGLELRRKHGRGGTAVGVARARDISNRKTLSPETVRRMHAFFSRHEKNKAGGEDDAGYIAWLLWGGDSGQSWAKRKVEQMDKSENQRSETYKAIAQRLGSAAKNDRPGAKARFAFKVGDRVHAGFGVAGGAGVVGTITKIEDGYAHIQADASASDRYGPKTHKAPLRLVTAAPKKAWESSRPGAKASFAQDARAVAQEILRQLGGGRFMAMVGGKNAMHGTFGGKPGLQVSIGKGAEGGINRLIVTLDPATDTYNMEFWRIGNRGLSTKKLSEASMVYADDLQRIFTDRTKFYTSMSRPGEKTEMAAIDAGMMDGAGNEVVIRMADGSRATARYNRGTGKWSLEGHADVPAFAKVRDLVAHLTKQGMARPGDKSKMGANEMSTPEAIAKMMEAWNKIEAQAKKQFPNASKEEIYRITKDAMNHALRTKFSRPGAKARMAKPQFRVRKLHNGYLAVDLNQGSGWERYDTTHEDSWDGLEPYERGYQKAYDRGLRWSGGAWRIPSIKSSRPGAKVTNAVREGCKISAEDEACLKMMAAADEKVSDKIRTLIAEGKPQKQAVAIALDLKRRGEL